MRGTHENTTRSQRVDCLANMSEGCLGRLEVPTGQINFAEKDLGAGFFKIEP